MTSTSSSVKVVSHPIINHALSTLRLSSTSARDFRHAISQISTVLAIEASSSLSTNAVQGQGPLSTFQGEEIKERIGLVPILRAGLGMTESCLTLFPENTSVLHIGLFREKVSLQPVEYYSKLPPQPTVDKVYILDPLVATGGTAIACVGMIRDWGVEMKDIKLLAVLGSDKGVKAVSSACPGLEILIGAIDPQLNEKGLIIPGLGDTGDRLFETQYQ